MVTGREDCVRCFTPTRATVVGSFAYEGHEYEVPLCAAHERMFDQEMLSWSRLGREKKIPGKTGPVPFPVTKGREVYVEPPVQRYVQERIAPEVISSWSFSDTASSWVKRNGFANTDVLWVIAANDKLDEDGVREDLRVYTHGDLRVTVDTSRRQVLTVGRRNSRKA